MTVTPSRLCGVLFLALLTISPVYGAERNQAVRAEFVRENPCPSTGKTTGRCPGWEVDHATPLCAGGSDTVENLQWLSKEQHSLKTKIDALRCRVLKMGSPANDNQPKP